MTEKIINFQDKEGRGIVGTLLLPEGEGPFPVVVVCHGFKGWRDQSHIKAIAESISEKGIATFRMDFTKYPGESDLEFENMTISYEVTILDTAVNYLRNVKEIDSTRIGLTGHSLGGLVVSWYAGNHSEIKSLVPLSAVYSFSKTFEKNYANFIKDAKEKGYGYVFSNSVGKYIKLKKDYYYDGINYEMDKVIKNIHCPVLIIQGTADRPVTMESAERYFNGLETTQKKLEKIEGADHNYTNPDNLAKIKEIVANWFAKTL